MLDKIIEKKYASGSRVICNPPPMDTDEDWIVLCHSHLCPEEVIDALENAGFSQDGEETYDAVLDLDMGGWASFKKMIDGTLVNYIITLDRDFYNKWVFATQLAKDLNLLQKSDRKTLFNAITDNDRVIVREKYSLY